MHGGRVCGGRAVFCLVFDSFRLSSPFLSVVPFYLPFFLLPSSFWSGLFVLLRTSQVEVAPTFFKGVDPNQVSRMKKKERIEPLYDRFNPPNAWRLSKRKG